MEYRVLSWIELNNYKPKPRLLNIELSFKLFFFNWVWTSQIELWTALVVIISTNEISLVLCLNLTNSRDTSLEEEHIPIILLRTIPSRFQSARRNFALMYIFFTCFLFSKAIFHAVWSLWKCYLTRHEYPSLFFLFPF